MTTNSYVGSITPKMFHTLIADAIAHATLAGEPNFRHAGASARAAVLTCAAVLECAANLCLSGAGMTIPERGTPLEKLQQYAGDRNLPAPAETDHRVQAIQELRRWRNKLIHHKAAPSPLNNVAEAASGVPSFEHHPGTTIHLQISQDPILWGHKDAMAVRCPQVS